MMKIQSLEAGSDRIEYKSLEIVEAIDRELARLHEEFVNLGDMHHKEFIKNLSPLHQSLLEISKLTKENYGK
jgi:hypothetical protein